MSLVSRRREGVHQSLRQPCRSLHHWSDPAGRSKHRHLFYNAHRYGDDYPFSLSDRGSLFVHNEGRRTLLGNYMGSSTQADVYEKTIDAVRRLRLASEREPWVTVTFDTRDARAQLILLTEELGSERWVNAFLGAVRVTELGFSPYGFLKYGV